MKLPLLQSWLPSSEPDFRPGTVRFSECGGKLLMEAEFQGGPQISSATAHGQRLWEHGDVAELFVQELGDESYREYQVAPNGFTLALRYPDTAGVALVRSGERKLEDFLTGEIPEVRITTTEEGWSVSLTVPLPSIAGDRFRMSCCRYDHIAGRPPVISSTSPHPVRDFHRPQDWRILVPVAG
jgi:hypothetical protein